MKSKHNYDEECHGLTVWNGDSDYVKEKDCIVASFYFAGYYNFKESYEKEGTKDFDVPGYEEADKWVENQKTAQLGILAGKCSCKKTNH